MTEPEFDLVRFAQLQPWTAILVAALAAMVVAMVLHRSGRAVLRRVTRAVPIMPALLAAIDRPASTVLPLAALQGVWQLAPDDLRLIGLLRHATALALIGALAWLVIRLIGGLADTVATRHPVTVADNLHARRVLTQTRVLSRTAMVVVAIAGVAVALMTFPGARQIGASLLASAGVVGIVAGIAARPVFSNLIAGLQIALAQPIRIDDVLIVKGEWGRVEEITGSYVVLKVWDERRLIVPLHWFIENPFENWTREGSQILGSASFHFDPATPVDILRAEARRIVQAAPEWDGRVFTVQVTDTTERTMQVRVLVSAQDAGAAFDLRCRIREELLAFVAGNLAHCLPQSRVVLREGTAGTADTPE